MKKGDDEHEIERSEGQPGPQRAAEPGGVTQAQHGRAVDLSPSPVVSTDVDGPAPAGAHDPLRLCIFATVALLASLGGPFTLAFFAALGLVGYVRARRAGLLRSKCLLGDTRLVLVYLAVLLLIAAWGIWSQLSP